MRRPLVSKRQARISGDDVETS